MARKTGGWGPVGVGNGVLVEATAVFVTTNATTVGSGLYAPTHRRAPANRPNTISPTAKRRVNIRC
jgi:hypothetical protein